MRKLILLLCTFAWGLAQETAQTVAVETPPPAASRPLIPLDDFILTGSGVGKKPEALVAQLPRQALRWTPIGKKDLFRGEGDVSFAGTKLENFTILTDGQNVSHLWANLAAGGKEQEGGLKTKLIMLFGRPKYTRSLSLGANPVSRTTWVAAATKLAYALECTYGSAGELFAEGEPLTTTLHVFPVGDPESVFFDPGLFALRDDEVEERFALVGVSGSAQSGFMIDKFFGIPAQVRCYCAFRKLQAVQITFPQNQYPDIGARIITAGTKTRFYESMKELLNMRLRSYPISSFDGPTQSEVIGKTNQINPTAPPSASLGNYPVELKSKNGVGKTTKGAKSGTTTSQALAIAAPSAVAPTDSSVERQTKVLWSPGSWSRNYLLYGRKLTAYAPGVGIAKALDPNLGGLVGTVNVQLTPLSAFRSATLDFTKYQDNVRPHPGGGVYLEVPMIDQGQLAYCFPASFARILQYYGFQINMYQVAKVASASATQGTDGYGRMAALFDGAKKLGVDYRKYDAKADLMGFVKSCIDLGQPILWSVPDHARLIVGYDQDKRVIIYSDSYGAGHESKRMPLAQAERINKGCAAFFPPDIIVSK